MKVLPLGDAPVKPPGQLPDFTLAHQLYRAGEQGQKHLFFRQGSKQGESTGQKVISGQHRLPAAPFLVQGGIAPALDGAIDHIIVDQGCGMDQLDRRTSLDQAVIRVLPGKPAKQRRRKNYQQRPDPFPRCLQDVVHHSL